MDPRERILFVLFIGQTVTSGGHVTRLFFEREAIVKTAFAFLRRRLGNFEPGRVDFTDNNYKGQRREDEGEFPQFPSRRMTTKKKKTPLPIPLFHRITNYKGILIKPRWRWVESNSRVYYADDLRAKAESRGKAVILYKRLGYCIQRRDRNKCVSC